MVTNLLDENQAPRVKLEPYKQSLQCASLAGCIELAREWLARCRNSHVECEEISKSEFNYPMRLIDIAGEAQRLVTINVVKSRLVRYVALSHCWGGAQPLKTLGSNIDRYVKDGIPHNDLPATFRDASKSILFLCNMTATKLDHWTPLSVATKRRPHDAGHITKSP